MFMHDHTDNLCMRAQLVHTQHLISFMQEHPINARLIAQLRHT